MLTKKDLKVGSFVRVSEEGCSRCGEVIDNCREEYIIRDLDGLKRKGPFFLYDFDNTGRNTITRLCEDKEAYLYMSAHIDRLKSKVSEAAEELERAKGKLKFYYEHAPKIIKPE